MDEPYEPEVNDYVIWTTEMGMVHEGWVYFKAEPSEPKRGWKTPQQYITIEIGTKEKEICEYTSGKPIRHKKHHICLLCYKDNWKELKFVRRRVSQTDNTDPDAPKKEEKESPENLSYGAYKSQRHRYIDP